MYENSNNERMTSFRTQPLNHSTTTGFTEDKIKSICLYDFRHPVRMYLALEFLGKELNFSPKYRELVKIAALFHDVGKMHVLDGVLNIPRKLNEFERAKMQQHTIMGHRIMKSGFYQLSNQVLTLASCVALKHHERLDGSGYPYKLTSDDIPEAVRAVTVVDIYDALRSRRPYRPSLSSDEAWEILLHETGLDFCMLKAFSRARKDIEKHVYACSPPGVRDVGEILAQTV